MGRSRYKILDEGYPYFVTCSLVGGVALFNRKPIAEFILNGLEYLQVERNITCYAWVIMPDHIHLILTGEDLGNKIRLFKSYSAKQILDYLRSAHKTRILQILRKLKLNHIKDRKHQVWQEGYHPECIYDDHNFEKVLDYIHYNPVVAGYVNDPVEWNYSSAKDYRGLTGCIPITLFGSDR